MPEETSSFEKTMDRPSESWSAQATYGTCLACTQAVRLTKTGNRTGRAKVIAQHKAKRVYGQHSVVTVVCSGTGHECAEDLNVAYDPRPHMRQWVRDEVD